MDRRGDSRRIASLAPRSGSSRTSRYAASPSLGPPRPARLLPRSGVSRGEPDGETHLRTRRGDSRRIASLALRILPAPRAASGTGRQARGWLRRLARTGAVLAALAAAGVCVAPLPAPARAAAARCCRRPRRYRRGPGITPRRTRQIQAALVKAGYLKHVTGHWNWATHEALVRFQRDHHWQTRWVPDSRALIALGLGPKRDEPPAAPRKTPATHRAAKAQHAAGGAAVHAKKQERQAHGHL